MARRNLTVRTGALAARILFDGTRATGVEYAAGRRRETALTRREVLLAGGAINSPQLLLMSGIGPAAHLETLNIPIVSNLAGVGGNLQDHVEVLIQHECTKPVTLFDAAKLRRKALIGAQWLVRKTGLGSTNHFETGGFIRSAPDIGWPDIQYHFLAMAVAYDGRNAAKAHGFQVHVGPMRSKSRGRIRLRSADPTVAPIITANWMTHPDDWVEMRRAIRLTREIFAQKAFNPYRGAEIAPGAAMSQDSDLDAFVRASGDSGYHYCGTCKMGSDAHAVVDASLKVHGVESLRVIDASVMPLIPNANTNAASIMIGEKGSDLVLGRELPPIHAPVFWADARTQR
jgi:choline dehydrogenase